MNHRKNLFPLTLLASMLGTTPAFADFDFSGPPDKDRSAKQTPQDQTKELDSAVSGVRNALGQKDGRRGAPADDDLANAGASVYGGAEDGDRRGKGDPGQIDVNSSVSIGLPSIGLPSIGMPSSSEASGGMPGIPNPMSGSGSSSSSSAGKPGTPGGSRGTQTSAADRALDKSLEGFDGIIMDEQQQARERQQAAGEGSGTAESNEGQSGGPTTMADAGGVDANGDANSDIAMRGDQPAMPSSNGRNSTTQGSAGARNTSKANGTQSSTSGAEDSASQTAENRIPDDIEPVNNRDIVGRQIKEAALAERDPVLRDKLWEELRRHQAGL